MEYSKISHSEKIEFLTNNGWERYGNGWVKSEWLTEDIGGRNYYRVENFDSAFIIAIEEEIKETTKMEASIETAKILERILFKVLIDLRWKDNREVIINFAKDKLYQWYLLECKSKPNPIITQEFNKS